VSRLPDSRIRSKLRELNGWEFDSNTIKKTFTFSRYMDGISFVMELAEKAEAADHHPDLVVGWCRIDVSFTSHDKGGVTDKCLYMAKETDKIKK